MSARTCLIGLWASASALLVAASAAMYQVAAFNVENMSGYGFISDEEQRLQRLLGQLPAPFILTACLTVLLTIIVHATLWRRARVRTPQRPSR